MKNVLTYLVVLAIIFGLWFWFGNHYKISPNGIERWKEYNNGTYGYSIWYPSSWQTLENSGSDVEITQKSGSGKITIDVSSKSQDFELEEYVVRVIYPNTMIQRKYIKFSGKDAIEFDKFCGTNVCGQPEILFFNNSDVFRISSVNAFDMFGPISETFKLK